MNKINKIKNSKKAIKKTRRTRKTRKTRKNKKKNKTKNTIYNKKGVSSDVSTSQFYLKNGRKFKKITCGGHSVMYYQSTGTSNDGANFKGKWFPTRYSTVEEIPKTGQIQKLTHDILEYDVNFFKSLLQL